MADSPSKRDRYRTRGITRIPAAMSPRTCPASSPSRSCVPGEHTGNAIAQQDVAGQSNLVRNSALPGMFGRPVDCALHGNVTWSSDRSGCRTPCVRAGSARRAVAWMRMGPAQTHGLSALALRAAERHLPISLHERTR
jgi:hypothetical protein